MTTPPATPAGDGIALTPELVASWRATLTTDQLDRLREIRHLGGRFLAEPTRRRWAMLLYAVGNMKRSAGTLHPDTWLDTPTGEAPRPDTVAIPLDPPLTLRAAGDREDTANPPVREAADGWQKLSHSTRGLGPATTTMVLAALWPRQHATFDTLTRHTAAAVLWPPDRLERPPQVSMAAYAHWYLPRMRHAARTLGLPLWEVEQGLFAAGRQTVAAIGWDGDWPAWLTKCRRQVLARNR